MTLARGGKRLGAGRKPKSKIAQQADEVFSGEAPKTVKEPVRATEPDRSGEPMMGWSLVQYVAGYLIGKDYRALGILARQNNGTALLRTVARFFDAAARYSEGEVKP